MLAFVFGAIIGAVIGFSFAAFGVAKAHENAVKTGKITIDGKSYALIEIYK